jgi:hypothetical protein
LNSSKTPNRILSDHPVKIQKGKKYHFNEEQDFSEVLALWEDLGVTESYRLIFDSIAQELDQSFRKDFFEFELNSLKELQEQLKRLSQEVKARDKTIELLLRFDKLLIKEKEPETRVIDDIVKTLSHLRVLSVNIVKNLVKFRKMSSHLILSGKFDAEKINRNYAFDALYLIKMKNDTDFLYASQMSKFFNFSMDSDPFLISLSNSSDLNIETVKTDMNGCVGKVQVLMDVETLNSVRECQFHMLQELILSELSPNQMSISTGKSSANQSTHKIHPQERLKPINQNNISMLKNSKSPIKDNQIGQVYTNHNNGKISSGKYKLSKIDNGMDKEKMSKANAELAAVVPRLTSSNKNASDMDSINKSNLMQQHQLESLLNDSRLSKKTDISIREKDLKMIERIINKENNININNSYHNDEEEYIVVKSDVNVMKKRVEKIEIDDSRIVKQEDQKTVALLRKMDEALKSSTDSFRDMSNNISAILEREEEEDKTNFQISKIYLEFSTEEFSKLTEEYLKYYLDLDEDQKAAFNIKSDLTSYLKGCFTKFIKIFYYKMFVGFVVVSYDPSCENSRLNLSHFSTTRTNFYYEILNEAINFLQDKLQHDELFLELFFALKDEKYHINETINDCIKKKLKFKWITLENTGTERKIKYKLLNKNSDKEPTQQLMKFMNNVTLSLGEMNELSSERQSQSNNESENELIFFNVICLLGQMMHDDLIEIENPQFKLFSGDKFRVLNIFN